MFKLFNYQLIILPQQIYLVTHDNIVSLLYITTINKYLIISVK